MKRQELTSRQLQVISSRDRVILVLGGPGTGKTTTALWAAREELQKPANTSWRRILFLTFSRTAVRQIAKTAPEVFGADANQVEVSTFHGFAWRLVKAFGRYVGQGNRVPSLQSQARTKLLGHDLSRLSYGDLIPAGKRILESRRIRNLLARRWPLIICDEFQDTNKEQWELLLDIRKDARLILLGDPNQMIYTFLSSEGVGPHRLREARSLADIVIDLEHSYRDPSGIIPRMAEAIRRREFSHPDVLEALREGRLTILSDIEDGNLVKVISEQIARLRKASARSIGIFGHSNEGVATLGAALAAIKLDHVLVGIPEAHAEALATLGTLTAFGAGLRNINDVRISLGTFLTACTRGKEPPRLAVLLARGESLPTGFEQALQILNQKLIDAATGKMEELVQAATDGWRSIRVTSGLRPWRRACNDFMSIAMPFRSLPVTEELVKRLVARIEERRPGNLFEHESSLASCVHLMNFHQTKGREADSVILVYRNDDYLARAIEKEPFADASRVLGNYTG